jgi:hypothetical protein
VSRTNNQIQKVDKLVNETLDAASNKTWGVRE